MTNAYIIERLIPYREHLNQRYQDVPSGQTVIQMKNICLAVYELVDIFEVSDQNLALQDIKSLTLSQSSEAQLKINQIADLTTTLEEDCFWDALNALTDPMEQFIDSVLDTHG